VRLFVYKELNMPHIFTVIAAVIAVVGLVMFSFEQEEVPESLLQPHVTHVEPVLISDQS
jgi:hypothetical protein